VINSLFWALAQLLLQKCVNLHVAQAGADHLKTLHSQHCTLVKIAMNERAVHPFCERFFLISAAKFAF
jgi:hypothetical protein